MLEIFLSLPSFLMAMIGCNITESFASDLEADLGSKDIVVSSGTANFIASMEKTEADTDDSSDVDTVLDAASPEDIRELQR